MLLSVTIADIFTSTVTNLARRAENEVGKMNLELKVSGNDGEAAVMLLAVRSVYHHLSFRVLYSRKFSSQKCAAVPKKARV